jgi:hypothetical protein
MLSANSFAVGLWLKPSEQSADFRRGVRVTVNAQHGKGSCYSGNIHTKSTSILNKVQARMPEPFKD